MLKNTRYQSIKRYSIVDIEDTEVGSVEDLVLSPKTLIPTHLLLGEGFFSEFQELIGNKPNIDELAPLSIMEVIEKNVILIHAKIDNLEKTNDKGKVLFPSILFSELFGYKIFNNNTVIECDINDFIIDGENSSITVLLFDLQQKFAMKGYRQKFEFVLPISTIEVKDSELHFSLDYEEIIDHVSKDLEMKSSGKSIIYI